MSGARRAVLPGEQRLASREKYCSCDHIPVNGMAARAVVPGTL
jgi:hypothetical protein